MRNLIFLSILLFFAGCQNGTSDTLISIIDPIWVDHGDGIIQFHTNNTEHYNKALYSTTTDVSNNIYELTAKKTSGSDTYGFGFLFCVDSNSYYRFFININQRYVIQKMVSGTWQEPLIPWSASVKLIAGYNNDNKLKVVRTNVDSKATFKIYINDKLENEFTDDNPINGTNARLAVSVNTEENEKFPYIPVEVWFKY
jgi:hypothetical protein